MAAKSQASKRCEVEISRRYLGKEGPSERYLIVAIPPLPPAQKIP